MVRYFPADSRSLDQKAPINNPVLTGDAKAPTPMTGDDDQSIATTEFVNDAVQAAIDNLEIPTVPEQQSVNFIGKTVSGATYLHLATDNGRRLEFTYGPPKSLIIQPEGDEPTPVDTTIKLLNLGVGDLSILAGLGVTIDSYNDVLKLRRYEEAVLVKRAAPNRWLLSGFYAGASGNPGNGGPGTTKPFTPIFLGVTPGNRSLTVRWTPSPYADVSHYEVFIRSGATPAPDNDDPFDYLPSANSITISNLTPLQTYWIWVRAVGYSGTKGDLSDFITGIPEKLSGADLTGIGKDQLDPNLVGIELVDEFPDTGNFPGRIIYHRPTAKLYRWNGTEWVSHIPAVDITGQIINEQIADGVLSAAKFMSQNRPTEIVAELPTTGNFLGRTVFLTTDQKLYRYDGTQWTAAISASDITGNLTSDQIESIAAAKIAGQLTSAQIESIAAAKITGTVVADQIADAVLTASKFATNTRPIEIVDALPSTGNFKGRLIYLTTDDKVYRFNGATWVRTVSAGDVSGVLTGAQIGDIEAAKLTGTIASTQISDNSISTPKLQAGAVSSAKIAAGAITAEKIAAKAITAGEIQAGAIGASELAANSVVAGKIAAGAVSADQVAANAIQAKHLLLSDWNNLVPDNQITALTNQESFHIAVSVVNPSSAGLGSKGHFLFTHPGAGAGAITLINSKRISIRPNEEYLFSLAHRRTAGTTYRIYAQILWYGATGTLLNTDNIISGLYSDATLRAGSASFVAPSTAVEAVFRITTDLTETAVGTAFAFGGWSCRIKNGASLIVDGSIVATKIAAGAVIAEKLATGAVEADKIAANAVTAVKISAGAVETAKLAAGAVVAEKIAANAIVADKIASGAVEADKLAANSVTAGKIEAGAVVADKIGANAVYARHLAIADLTNYVPDNQMQDPSSWVMPAGWNNNPTGGASFDSRGVMSFNETGTGYGGDLKSKQFVVEPGKPYYVRFQAWKNNTLAEIWARIQWYNTAGVAVGSPTTIYTGALPAGVNPYSLSITVPNGVQFGEFLFAINRSNTNSTVIIAAPMIRRINGGELIVDGAILAQHLDANSVVAGKIAANAVTADNIAANAVTAGKILAGEIGTSHLAANAVRAKHLMITDTTNFVSNPTLNDGSSDGWTLSNGTVIEHTDTSAPVKWVFNSPQSSQMIADPHSAIGTDGGAIPVAPGQVYHFNAYWWRHVIGARLGFYEMLLYDRDRNFLQTISVTAYNANTQVSGFYEGQLKVPDNATTTAFARFRIRTQSTAGAVLRVGGVVIRRAYGGRLIVDGGIETAHLQALSIDAGKIAANAVTTDKLNADAVTADKISSNAVTTDKLNANAVTADKILANTITGDKLQANTITTREMVISNFSNVFPDPYFASPSTPSSVGNGWSFGTGSGLGYNGVSTYLERGSGASGGIITRDIACSPGDAFRLSVWGARISATAGSMRVYFQFRQASGAATQNVFLPVWSTADALNSWVERSSDLIAPANTISCRMVIDTAGGSVTGIYRLGFLSLIRRADAKLIVDGEIDATKIKTDSITADKIKTYNLTAANATFGNVNISNANIGTLQVGTSNIANGAVSEIQFQDNGYNGNIAIVNNWTVFSTLVVSGLANTKRLLKSYGEIYTPQPSPEINGVTCFYNYRIRRGSTVIKSSQRTLQPQKIGITENFEWRDELILFAVDTAGPADATYVFEIQRENLTTPIGIRDCYAEIMELKR